jgi:Yip1 domain
MVAPWLASLFRRSYRIIRYPRTEWAVVRSENPRWGSVLVGHVLPLSLVPALGWATGLALTGALPDMALGPVLAYAQSVALTWVLYVMCVILLAVMLYFLGPMYETDRSWSSAVAVAGYGTTPLLFAGALLVMPVLVMAGMVAMVHCFGLYYAGAKQVCGCRASDSAEYVALACLLAAAVTVALGAVGGALGVI